MLLLKRNSQHNHGTWGLPGGNVDATDTSLLETATREAAEEMGPDLPPFVVAAEVLTQRGKRWARPRAMPCRADTLWAATHRLPAAVQAPKALHCVCGTHQLPGQGCLGAAAQRGALGVALVQAG